MIAALAVAALASAQEPDRAERVLILRSGEIRRGTVVDLAAESVTLLESDGIQRVYAFALLDANCAYRLKREQTDASDPQERLLLGDFALTHGLYGQAIREYEAAAALDPAFREPTEMRIRMAREEDGRERIARAGRFMAERDWRKAAEALRRLLEEYPEGPFTDQAGTLLEVIQREVERELAEREDARRQADQAAVVADRTTALDRAEGRVREAVELWVRGLDEEAAGNTAAAEATWRDAVERLRAAREEAGPLREDPAVRDRVIAVDREAVTWLVRALNSLARMRTAEGDYRGGLAWVNEVLKLSPDDGFANQIRLMLTEHRLRER